MSGATVDASTMIAALDPDHVNHDRAAAQLRSASEPLWMHPITLAEILVPYVEPTEMMHRLHSIGVNVFDADQDLPTMTRQHAMDLARVRRLSGAKMPDVCVIATAYATRTPILTLDKALVGAAVRFADAQRGDPHPGVQDMAREAMERWEPLLDRLA